MTSVIWISSCGSVGFTGFMSVRVAPDAIPALWSETMPFETVLASVLTSFVSGDLGSFPLGLRSLYT